ncbi:Endochitinase 1 [Boothiomyces sp. JEL0838]|nr:Endochitinase 1 [Boothiomyces sp. JEL0838]
MLGFLLYLSQVECTRVVGYWSLTATGSGTCQLSPMWTPSTPGFAQYYTHLNYGFSPLINANLVIGDPTPAEIAKYNDLLALKKTYPSLSVGMTFGGDIVDISPMSKACATDSARTTFATSTVQWTRKYGFDGIDIDWEFPGDTNRGGTANDPANFVLCMKALRDAIEAEQIPSGKSKLWLSAALPGGAGWGSHYQVDKSIQYVDWFNIMAYNIQGTWFSVAQCSAPLYDPFRGKGNTGNDIDAAVKYFVGQSGNQPGKFNLGMSFWGIAYVLQNPSNNQLGLADTFTGNQKLANPGPCSQQPGYMAYFETVQLLQQNNPQTSLDPKGDCKYFTYNTDQLVAYEDPDTIKVKVQYALDQKLGGVSIWGMDSDTKVLDMHKSVSGVTGVSNSPQSSPSTPGNTSGGSNSTTSSGSNTNSSGGSDSGNSSPQPTRSANSAVTNGISLALIAALLSLQ